MVRVSDITVYLKCPRKLYFINKGYVIKQTDAKRLILKELALTYPYFAGQNKELLKDTLNSELERISHEIRAIYPTELSDIDDDTLKASISEVSSYIETISSNLYLYSKFYKNEEIKQETFLSEKFQLSGTPDRIIKNDFFSPSIIKISDMPENGIWYSDRVQLTAYAMLIGEKYNSVVSKGFVEYAKYGIIREAAIKTQERRIVLMINNKIKKIQNGFMPEKPDNAPCEYCEFKEMCNVKSTFASRFF